MSTARPTTGEQPNSPRQWNEGQAIWIARTWQVERGTGTTYVPVLSESTADGYYQRHRIEPGPAGYELLTLEFTSTLTGGGLSPADATSRWTLTAATENVPLTYLGQDYRAAWDHNLYVPATDRTGYSRPGWWETASDLGDANGVTYLWAKEDPGEWWAKVEDKGKPGVDGFLAARPVARYEYWHATKNTAVAELKAVGTLQTPSETFGYSGGTWLVTFAEVTQDGSSWRAMVEYTYNPSGWDTDLYS